jgi:cytochrome P450
MTRNPMEAWPAEVYRTPFATARVAGRDIAFICDPALVRALFIDHADLLARDSGTVRALGAALGRGILLADGAAWRWQRQAVAPVFRPARIDAYIPAMSRAAARTATRWQAQADTAGIDLLADMERLSFDMMAETLMSGDADLDLGAIGPAIGEILRPAPWPLMLSSLGAPGWVPYPGKRTARRACRDARRVVRGLIARRRTRHPDAPPADDLLDHLLAASNPSNARGMNDAELTDNLLTFIASGYETTALGLFWLFQLLSDAPAVEQLMVREINQVAGGRPLEPEMLHRLPYTRQVVNEALRLYPPVPALTRELTRHVTIGQHRLYPGMQIVVPIFAIHRHRALWQAPDSFDPDRFAPDRAATRDRGTFIPFGLGPRGCIGMGFSMTQILSAVAVLAPRFALRRAQAGMPPCRQQITLRPDGDTHMILVTRAASRPTQRDAGARLPLPDLATSG